MYFHLLRSGRAISLGYFHGLATVCLYLSCLISCQFYLFLLSSASLGHGSTCHVEKFYWEVIIPYKTFISSLL